MTDLTKQLIQELYSTSSVTENKTLQLVIRGLEARSSNSSEDALEQALADLSEINEKLKDAEVDTVVKKFKKLSNTPAKKLKAADEKPGVKAKLEKIKESAGSYSDPIVKSVIAGLEANLSNGLESVVAESVVTKLKPFSYDPVINTVVNELNSWINDNRSEIAIFNTINSLRQIPNQYYTDLCEKLGTAIVEGKITSDYLAMSLSESTEIPAIKQLLNKLSQLESAKNGGFNLGTGFGSTKIAPVVGVYSKSGDSVKVLVENFVLELDTVTEEPKIVSFVDLKKSDDSAFAEVVEAFVSLGFKPTANGIEAKGKGNKIAFVVDESGSLQFKLNDKVVEDLTSSEIYSTLIVESADFKNKVSTVLSNANSVAQFEFVQRIVNESTQCYAINTEKSGIFVLTSQGLNQHDAISFHKYVAENFKYDVSDLYSIQLNEKQKQVKKANEKKQKIKEDIKKLEESISKLDLVIDEADDATQDQLEQLKHTIQSNIVSLKDEYLTLEESLMDKKKA